VYYPLLTEWEEMAMAYTYRCADFLGMESCPAAFTAETEDELWRHIELHAKLAHQENPEKWSDEDRRQMKDVITTR
jgi:predicted small metal-binding protein